MLSYHKNIRSFTNFYNTKLLYENINIFKKRVSINNKVSLSIFLSEISNYKKYN